MNEKKPHKLLNVPGAYELFLSIREASALSGVCPDSLRRWIRTGRLRGFGHPGFLRIYLPDLLPVVDPDAELPAGVKERASRLTEISRLRRIAEKYRSRPMVTERQD